MLFPSVASNRYVETEWRVNKVFWVTQTKAETDFRLAITKKLKVSFQLVEKWMRLVEGKCCMQEVSQVLM